MSRYSEDAEAFRSHARREAAKKFNEVVRRNTPSWDDRPMTDDQQAFADDAILRAARKFHEQTRDTSDWDYPSR